MPTTRDLVFDRVMVDFLARGGARVSWRLHRLYASPPLTYPGPQGAFGPQGPMGDRLFRIQVGTTGDPEADDWVDAAAGAYDVGSLVDNTARAHGAHWAVWYRVVMVDGVGTHYSPPVAAEATLPMKDWLRARHHLRQAHLIFRHCTAIDGWILRRRRVGAELDSTTPTAMAIDPWTGDLIRPTAASGGYGTDRLGGYFAPSRALVQMDPSAHGEAINEAGGTEDQPVIVNPGFVVPFPGVLARDAFVEDDSDYRYYIRRVENTAEVRGVAILARCEFHRAPVGDPLYDVPVPD
jgi:hypothetical protein